MTIDEIYRKKKISVRSYHVCKQNDLNSVKELKDYFCKHKSFKELRNCGNKSNEELIKICLEKQDRIIKSLKTEQEKTSRLKKIIVGLNRIQREVINSFILINTNSLSVRNKNAIYSYLNGNLKVKQFANSILLVENFQFHKIKNIGSKSVTELEVYISLIRDFIFEVNQSNNERYLISLKNDFLIRRTYSISNIPKEVLETESIFLLTRFLLERNAFYDKTQTLIVKNSLKLFYKHEQLTLDNISNLVNLSRERVRQIRKICLEKLFSKLCFIQNFNDDLYQKYGLDINSKQLEIDDCIISKVNNINKTEFSKEFITFIIYVYLSDRYELIGNLEDVLQHKLFNSRNRYNWKNFYLIDSKIIQELDFYKFTEDINNRLRDKVEETYFFNFKSYLSRFLIKNNTSALRIVFSIGENILNNEFDLFLDIDENIIFKRNTSKQAYEYAFEALEKLAKPSKVKIIFEKVIELYPNYDTEESKIRAAMKRKYGFVPIGRKSVFGLKKWEEELKNFKGGTIRNIVEEYLSRFSSPKHISEITKHVLKYRPRSNQYSILQNLKLDVSGLYIFYKNSYVGISNKKYDNNFIKLSSINTPEKKSWEERFDIFKKFVEKEKRLPYSNGATEKEIRLYRWFNGQRVKAEKGKLNSQKISEIKNIIEKYPRKNRNKRLKESYEKLLIFIKKNKRPPSTSKKGESSLYYFFYNQRKLFEKNKLENYEKLKFIEIMKILKN